MEAALVRREVFGKPQRRDEEVIEVAVEEEVARQREAGEARPWNLFDLGCSAENPWVKGELQSRLRKQVEEQGYLDPEGIHMALRIGWGEKPQLAEWLRRALDE